MTDTPRVDLTNCDREPIHIPGSIQPHGCLLACDAAAVTILRHSRNCGQMLGIEDALNGRDLAGVAGPELTHELRNALSRAQLSGRSALLFDQALPNGRRFDVSVHRFKGSAIIEFEPAQGEIAAPLEMARAMTGRIATIDRIDRLTRDGARLVQAALGYDRVMIYQFGPDGAGKVISEVKRGDLESFLGQYFPATDIPQQARALYLKNSIRIISDANFERIAIEPALDASGEPLDLSFAHLRSVSPIHCEYLRNMGVGASMSISIIVDGELWGLIACHHYGPRTLTMAQRVAAEMFGEFFSLHLSALGHKQTLEAAHAARAALDAFLRDTVGTLDINAMLREKMPEFSKLIPADSAAMWLNGQLTNVGEVPPRETILALTRFAENVAEGQIWASHKLANAVPGAEAYADTAAGVLIVPLSQRPRDFLFFFRKEVVHTLDWAGNPDKTYETGPLGDRLTPRKSFAIWKETVRHESTPWTEADRKFAEAARAALVEVILQHSERLADERSKAELRQRMLNEELNHRVKNILAVIRSLVVHPTADGETLENYANSLRGRIQALSLAHDQVVRSDGGGALADLLKAELMPYWAGGERIALEGPPVWMDARAYSIMALVLHELSTNAAKYGALSASNGQLSVSWSLNETGACRLLWRESGGPRVEMPSRRGFGSVLIERSVPFDLGGTSDLDYKADGLQAEFLIPGRFISLREAPVLPRKDDDMAPDENFTGLLEGRTALLVEDQMLIAIDLEQILEEAGVRILATLTTSRDAIEFLSRHRPDFAVLDVNLGSETSEAIARTLMVQGSPFLFATGYGDDGAIPDDLARVPVVRKPFERDAILAELGALIGPGVSAG
ncbi:Bacteriophytochrome (light-regulated signal transduction histidine kinase) [Sphingopyxis sp. YR583]|uniref:HWE histidine kinase domain-containing protein n=1 Tax=Sphingopyxis sp. YR583 TaxID=1881047 RepID=UPI0008A80694|nr:HWE histidine kinase domain-containing protein [Sphingopyxis sp. YR583]SEH13098.1 Bacteriophytochrome (light-regulated signal transduction histidine kinase) [Sphingopyxis sp. YR583]